MQEIFTKLYILFVMNTSYIGETFFIHWFTDPPTVNIQIVKNKKNKFGCQKFINWGSDMKYASSKL